MSTIQETLDQRNNTHGDYVMQCDETQRMKFMFKQMHTYEMMPNYMREALDMLAVKLGRISAGDMRFADSWHDIAGYATLVEQTILKETGKL